jgi:CHASE2 domain-containing sensor protein
VTTRRRSAIIFRWDGVGFFLAWRINMPRELAIAFWSMVAACLFSFGMAALVAHYV